MKFIKYLYIYVILISVQISFGQDYKEIKNDSANSFYYIIEGDTIPKEFIDLEEVIL